MANGVAQAPSKGRLFASSGQLPPCRNAISVLLDLSYTLFLKFFFYFKKTCNLNVLVKFLSFTNIIWEIKTHTKKVSFAELACGPLT